MKFQRLFLLGMGLVPAAFIGWRALLADVPWTVDRWLFFAWLMFPGVIGSAAALSSQSIVDWFWKHLWRLVLAYVGGTGLVMALGVALDPRERASGTAITIGLVFGVVGAILLGLSIFGSKRCVDRIVESL